MGKGVSLTGRVTDGKTPVDRQIVILSARKPRGRAFQKRPWIADTNTDLHSDGANVNANATPDHRDAYTDDDQHAGAPHTDILNANSNGDENTNAHKNAHRHGHADPHEHDHADLYAGPQSNGHRHPARGMRGSGAARGF